jgi:predicted RNA-binding protein (virulence factor B family)
MNELLGRVCSLAVLRVAPEGALLARDTGDTGRGEVVLLPRGELSRAASAAETAEGLARGASLEVFVYLDSDDRPTATLRTPRLRLGEVAFLEVKDVGQFGAFVDWGLPKELLVPFAEQTRALRVGERHPIGLYVDTSGRLAGTMRVAEMLQQVRGGFAEDAWVEGEAWRNEPELGLFVIVERKYVALVPTHEPHTLVRGQAARFRVTNILPDGKLELSLRKHAYEELEADATKILALLSRSDAPKVSDRSSPDELRALFGLSKKAFKRAAGRLLSTGALRVDAEGFYAVHHSGGGCGPGTIPTRSGSTPASPGGRASRSR